MTLTRGGDWTVGMAGSRMIRPAWRASGGYLCAGSAVHYREGMGPRASGTVFLPSLAYDGDRIRQVRAGRGRYWEMGMTIELTLLGWTLVLALVQIMLAAGLRLGETGAAYNMSARDTEPPPPRPVTARLQRAQSNLFETLPLFAAAVLIAHVAGRNGEMTYWGCWLYLVARIVYVPLYAAGVPVLRTLVWGVSLGGLALVLAAILRA